MYIYNRICNFAVVTTSDWVLRWCNVLNWWNVQFWQSMECASICMSGFMPPTFAEFGLFLAWRIFSNVYPFFVVWRAVCFCEEIFSHYSVRFISFWNSTLIFTSHVLTQQFVEMFTCSKLLFVVSSQCWAIFFSQFLFPLSRLVYFTPCAAPNTTETLCFRHPRLIIALVLARRINAHSFKCPNCFSFFSDLHFINRYFCSVWPGYFHAHNMGTNTQNPPLCPSPINCQISANFRFWRFFKLLF